MDEELDTSSDVSSDVDTDVSDVEFDDTDTSDVSDDIPEDDYSNDEEFTDNTDGDYEEDTDSLDEDVDVENDDFTEDDVEIEDIAEDSISEIEEDSETENFDDELSDVDDDIEEDTEDSDETEDMEPSEEMDEIEEDTEEFQETDEEIDGDDEVIEEDVEDVAEDTVTETEEDVAEDTAGEIEEGVAEETETEEDAVEDTATETEEGVAEETATETEEGVAEETATETEEGIGDETVTVTEEGVTEETAAETEEGVAEETAAETEEGVGDETVTETEEGVAEDTATETEEGVTEETATETEEGVTDDTTNEVEGSKNALENSDITEKTPQQRLSEYMNEHNYGPDDFATYSQDPEWRNIQRDAYPDYEMPELSRENAQSQLSAYMNEHNYGIDDFETYSKDPIWQELHSAAYPEYELSSDNHNMENVSDTLNVDTRFENVSYSQGQNDFGALGTCGPTSIANSLNRITNSFDYSENSVLHNAMENDLCFKSDNPYSNGGTTTRDIVNIIDNVKGNNEIYTEVYEYDNALGVNELAERISDSDTVAMVGVDSATLWDRRGDVSNSGLFQHTDAPSDHWITVDSPIKGEDGQLTGFNIVDSGGGVSEVSRDKFESMYLGDDTHTISDPTAILISRNSGNLSGVGNEYSRYDMFDKTEEYKGSAYISDGGDPPSENGLYEKFNELPTEEKLSEFDKMTSAEVYDMVKNSSESWPVDGYDLITPENAKEFIKLNVDSNGDTSFNLDWPKYGGYDPKSISSLENLDGIVEVSRDGGDGGYTMGLGKNEDGTYPNNSERSIPKSSAEVNTGVFDVDRYKNAVDIVVGDNKSDDEKISSLMNEGYDFESSVNMLRDYENWKSRPEIVGDNSISDGVKFANANINMKYGVYGKAAPWRVADVPMKGGAGQMNTVFSWGTCKKSGIIKNIGRAKIC